MIQKKVLQEALTNFYLIMDNLNYDFAADKAREMLQTERIELLSTTDQNDFDDEYQITLYYIITDHIFIYRVRPTIYNLDLYKDKIVSFDTTYLSEYNQFEQYLNQFMALKTNDPEAANDKLRNEHGFDLNTFEDNMLEQNNNAPFNTWRECIQTMRSSNEDEMRKAIIAYLTYTESDEWLTDLLYECPDIINPNIESILMSKPEQLPD